MGLRGDPCDKRGGDKGWDEAEATAGREDLCLGVAKEKPLVMRKKKLFKASHFCKINNSAIKSFIPKLTLSTLSGSRGFDDSVIRDMSHECHIKVYLPASPALRVSRRASLTCEP